MPTLLIRETGKNPEKSKEFFTELFNTYILLDIIFFPIIFLTLKKSLQSTDIFNNFNLSIIIISLLLTQIANLLYAYYIGIKKQNYTSFLRDTLLRVIRVISFFVLYIFLSNYIAYILAAVISLSVPFIISLTKLKKIKSFRIKWIFGNSWQFYLISITYTLYNNFSKILQKAYATNEAVGYLSIGITLGSIGAMLGSALASVTMPEFAQAWKEKNMEKIDYVFKEVSRWNSFIILPLIIFLITNLNRVLTFLGKDYSNGTIIVSLILISQFINSFVDQMGHY